MSEPTYTCFQVIGKFDERVFTREYIIPDDENLIPDGFMELFKSIKTKPEPVEAVFDKWDLDSRILKVANFNIYHEICYSDLNVLISKKYTGLMYL